MEEPQTRSLYKSNNSFLGYPAACWQPKQPNQVGSLEFWGSVYSSSTSFFLAQRYTNPSILILSSFSCLVTFHFWSCPSFKLIVCSANFDALYLTPNLSCYFGFRANFELGFSESRIKLLEPRIIKNTWRPTCPFILSFSDQLWS